MSKVTPSKERSSPAIASFVLGTIQTILMCLMVAIVITVLDNSKTVSLCLVGEECPKFGDLTAAEQWITRKEMVFFFVSNFLAFLGIFTGITGLVETSKTKKDGAALAQFGLVASIVSIITTIIILWNVDLPL